MGKVTVLVTDNEYGTNIEAFDNYNQAELDLYNYVKDYWAEVSDLPIPEDHKKAIDFYFYKKQGEEQYVLQEVSVASSIGLQTA